MHIRPFKGYRPRPDLASRVVLVPNNLLNEPDRRRAAAKNPYSFAHVVKPKIDFPDATIKKSDDELFAYASNYFEKLVEEGVMVRDTVPTFYIYRSTTAHLSQTGLLCCVSVEDYDKGLILKHELTQRHKELMNKKQIALTRLSGNPVFLAYRPVSEIKQFIDGLTCETPLYDFVTEAGWRQQMWLVQSPAQIEKLIDLFDRLVPVCYIADGHHRCAAAAQFAREFAHRSDYRTYDFRYLLVGLFASDQLQIFDYNRLVHTLNGLTASQFIERIYEKFEVKPASERPYRPEQPHRFGMYLEGQWHELTPRPGTFSDDPIGRLDVTILQQNLLAPILGIQDPRNDKNIDFIPGTRGTRELEKRVDKHRASVAFTLYPVTMEELLDVADMGQTMPPKSTWFEPKLLSGLVVFKMEC